MNEIRKIEADEIIRNTNTLPVQYNVSPDMPNLADKLMEIADEARNNSYCLYSNYSVGAALLCGDGSIYTGCNVETVAYSVVCAERVAICKAISDGKKEFLAIAVSGGKKGEISSTCSPCGVCRQFISEFSKEANIAVIMRNREMEVETVPISELLPYSFEM